MNRYGWVLQVPTMVLNISKKYLLHIYSFSATTFIFIALVNSAFRSFLMHTLMRPHLENSLVKVGLVCIAYLVLLSFVMRGFWFEDFSLKYNFTNIVDILLSAICADSVTHRRMETRFPGGPDLKLPCSTNFCPVIATNCEIFSYAVLSTTFWQIMYKIYVWALLHVTTPTFKQNRLRIKEKLL